MEEETLNSLRYCFQRILVPSVVIMGMLGNFVTVIVLTRRGMRCSTNTYLSALAVADMVFLLFNFILSLQHYPNIHRAKYEIYWRTYGLSHWLCDASSYSSIYLTVSFTIERYIAVCHPIRGQVLCTESRAKKVIAVVVILCFLLTSTTSFEYQLNTDEKFVNRLTGSDCEPPPPLNLEGHENGTRVSNDSLPVLAASGPDWEDFKLGEEPKALSLVSKIKETFGGGELVLVSPNGGLREEIDSVTAFPLLTTTDPGKNINSSQDDVNSQTKNDKDEHCVLEYFLKAVPSELGMDETYQSIFYTTSSILFIFLPLVLLATFNCFLIAAVHKSHTMRRQMTKSRKAHSTAAQENRMTVTLIAVVVLFLCCQTPTAIYMIYSSWAGHQPQDEREINLSKAIGNILNFLVILNAACNFLLYCALSAKYRKTVKDLILRRGQRLQRQSTFNTRLSRYLSRTPAERDRSRRDTESSVRQKLNSSRSFNEEFAKKAELALLKDDYFNRNRMPSLSAAARPSISPSIDTSRKNSSVSIQKPVTPSPRSTFLKPSDSQRSLTRSQSLVLPVKTKHSPDCKSNPLNI